MTMILPFEAAVAQLVRMGFARDAAEREVNRQLLGVRVVVDPRIPPGAVRFVQDGRLAGEIVNVETAAGGCSPLKLVLPWSALESDNRKYAATIRGGSPLLVMRPDYREAKAKARDIARTAMLGNPVSIPLALVARVWLPDNRPGHDIANFAKCAHDALEKVVYTSDQWLHDVRWIRAGVDIDRPRAEITITPLTP